MKLIRLTERIWYLPLEGERDRPCLCYVRGDRWSLAVDAGHSSAHTADFYTALEREGLPLPGLTVLTHWHWDHTFGMNAVRGLTLANRLTNEYLKAVQTRMEREGTGWFFALDERIGIEYAGNLPVIVTLADLIYEGRLEIDAGNCPVRVFQAEAPHTDDSTLIEVPGEKVLFLGDAIGGMFPTWEMDPVLCRNLADTIDGMDVQTCVGSHWEPMTKRETVAYLRWEARGCTESSSCHGAE